MLQVLSWFVAAWTWQAAVASPVHSLTQLGQLHGQYSSIFPNGNRNAASHRWARYVMERSHTMEESIFKLLMSGFCPVSGSIVNPFDRARWRVTLDHVGGGRSQGIVYYCCWPCICDTQDFIKVDTKNVTTLEGTKPYHFLVVGNPCEDAKKLEPWQRSAPDVTCDGTHLEKAVLSDHGNIIIGIFHEYDDSFAAVHFNDESLIEEECATRAENNYNSGMGQIFRGVAAITNISSTPLPLSERKPVIPIVTSTKDGFFVESSHKLSYNPDQKNYGISVFDIDADGKLEAFVAGNGVPNLALKFNQEADAFIDVALDHAVLQDPSGSAIGVSACDVDEDGYEELYILNTDAYQGQTETSDLLIDWRSDHYADLFKDPQNQNSSNFVAGRSSGCLDRNGHGRYGVVVANYGGPFKLYEQEDSVIVDSAPEVGMNKTTGGRSIVAGPIISNRMDVFANNEGWYTGGDRLLKSSSIEDPAVQVEDPLPSRNVFRRLNHAQATGVSRNMMERPNFFFLHNGSDTFVDAAAAVGLLDIYNTGRGTALLDSNGDGKIDIVYGNWRSQHRLYIQGEDSKGCVKFADFAPPAMQRYSSIRTVIVADWDNDGYEEIFYNNIPGENRLFRKLPTDADWTLVEIGDALEPYGYGTGAAVGDFDEDGQLELLVSHGEAGPQPLTYYTPLSGKSNNWLRVFPKTSQGAPARGALVVLSAGGRQQLRVIDSGSGYLCQMEPVAHFGLGSLSDVEWISVTWPDGAKFSFKPSDINKLYHVSKDHATETVPPTEFEFTMEEHCLKRTGWTDPYMKPSSSPVMTPAGTLGTTSASEPRPEPEPEPEPEPTNKGTIVVPSEPSQPNPAANDELTSEANDAGRGSSRTLALLVANVCLLSIFFNGHK